MAGRIILMGSGELTVSMVAVHKEALADLGPSAHAVFLDTPAGFQLNADQISQRAVSYFATQIHHPLGIVSFKSATTLSPEQAERTFSELRRARYVLVGPGSPTYAVRQWGESPVPEILKRLVASGGCLVAASAAALTVGRYTLPVYEIYKVGEDLHWTDGINILGYFGMNCVVIPHWNNAEGGTHDTRFCFMGEPRFRILESLFPEDTVILGIDEHTACIIDIEAGVASVRGIGCVTVRNRGGEQLFGRGERFNLSVLRTSAPVKTVQGRAEQRTPSGVERPEPKFWRSVHECEDRFAKSLDEHRAADATAALLELDRLIWQALEEREDPERITQAREIFREMIVSLGSHMQGIPRNRQECLAPLVEAILELRTRYRNARQWAIADEIRACLEQAHIIVEDFPQGSKWRLSS